MFLNGSLSLRIAFYKVLSIRPDKSMYYLKKKILRTIYEGHTILVLIIQDCLWSFCNVGSIPSQNKFTLFYRDDFLIELLEIKNPI